jgi:hypothetical protein
VQTTYTSVLARRVGISDDFATLPYEAGWATEAVFFVQAEGDHPDLTIAAEVSPDGLAWLRRGSPVVLASDEPLAELPLTCFGSWLRLTLTGATAQRPARVLVHLTLKG